MAVRDRLTVLVCGLVVAALFTACMATPPATADVPTASAIVPTARPAAAATETWSVTEPFGGYVADDRFSGLVSGGPGYIAVGNESGGSGSETSTFVWSSSDGRSWTRQTGGTFNNASMNGLVTTDDGTVVAVGRDFATDASLAWSSQDGSVWQPADGNWSAIGEFASVSNGDHGLMAVGHNGLNGGTGTIWSAEDQSSWHLAAEVAGTSDLFGIADSAHGLVAVGRARAVSGGGYVGASATSSDGRTWVSNPMDCGVGSCEFDLVVDTPIGFLAVGGSTTGVAVSAVSSDGSQWTFSKPPLGFDGLWFDRVFWVDGAAMAVGHTSQGISAWESSDGLTWTHETVLPRSAGSYASAGLAGDKVVVLGGPLDPASANATSGVHGPAAWVYAAR